MSYIDDENERQLKALELKIRREYQKAYKQIEKKAREYFAVFEVRDNAMRKALEEGKYPTLYGENSKLKPEEHYKQWRLNQIARGKRWEELRDKIADDLENASKIAVKIINNQLPYTFMFNADYTAYELEKNYMGISWTLANEEAIQELIKGNNHTEFKTVRDNPVRRYKWNSQKIESAVIGGIIQGQTIKELSSAFFQVMESNKKSAIRNARTSFTSASNAGVQSRLEQAEKMGIETMKEWVCTHDNRTRDSHAHLDGERVPINEKFSNHLRYPADPEGEPSEVYNCRCTMISVVNNRPKRGSKEDIHKYDTFKTWKKGLK